MWKVVNIILSCRPLNFDGECDDNITFDRRDRRDVVTMSKARLPDPRKPDTLTLHLMTQFVTEITDR